MTGWTPAGIRPDSGGHPGPHTQPQHQGHEPLGKAKRSWAARTSQEDAWSSLPGVSERRQALRVRSEEHRLSLSLKYSRNGHLCEPQQGREQLRTGCEEHPSGHLPILERCAHVALGYVQGHGLTTNGEKVSLRSAQFRTFSSSVPPARGRLL